MPPNTVNNSSTENVPVRRKGQQQATNEPKADQQANEQTDSKSTPPKKGLHTDVRVTIAMAIAAFLVVLFSPETLKQLAKLKRSINKVGPVDPYSDSRPIQPGKAPLTGSVVDPDTGVEYEYHQFMATVEQHFPNIR